MAHWEWCVHTADFFVAEKPYKKCAGCGRSLAFTHENITHYGREHYHLTCLLDLLPPPAQREFHFLDPHFP